MNWLSWVTWRLSVGKTPLQPPVSTVLWHLQNIIKSSSSAPALEIHRAQAPADLSINFLLVNSFSSVSQGQQTPPLIPTIPLLPAPTTSTHTIHLALFPRGMTSSYTWPLSFRSEGWFKLWLHCPRFMAPSLAPFKVFFCSPQSLQTSLMDKFLTMDRFNHNKQSESFKKVDDIFGSFRNVSLFVTLCLCSCDIWFPSTGQISYLSNAESQHRLGCFAFFGIIIWNTLLLFCQGKNLRWTIIMKWLVDWLERLQFFRWENFSCFVFLWTKYDVQVLVQMIDTR